MAQKRLIKEMKMIEKNKIPHIAARPDSSNIYVWHFLIFGPADSPFRGGEYYGTIHFPLKYPLEPPEIKLHTPNGRFEPSAKICLSYTNYHRETWCPGWNCSTMLLGLLSLMVDLKTLTTGGVQTNHQTKRRLARESRKWNEKKGIVKYFGGKLIKEYREEYGWKGEEEEEKGVTLGGVGGEGEGGEGGGKVLVGMLVLLLVLLVLGLVLGGGGGRRSFDVSIKIYNNHFICLLR